MTGGGLGSESSARDPYAHPELFGSLDSMEGVPVWVDPVESAAERAGRSLWQQRGHVVFDRLGEVLPGFVLALALALTGGLLAEWSGTSLLGLESSPVSPIMVAIGLGLLLRNTIGLPSVYEAGLQIALKNVLRVGVALLGIRLSLSAVGTVGLVAIPIVIACIASALVVVTACSRALGLPGRLGTLIAAGTAICGNTAVVAIGPVIGAKKDEVSYAVGCITLFGLIALLAYPALSNTLFLGDARAAGLFLGTAIHDTAQVAGAGMVYLQQFGDPLALDTATVTKLVRNLFMIAVVPLMAVVYHRSAAARSRVKRPSVRQLVPLFVFGFVAMSALRTVGDVGERPFGLLSTGAWESVVDGVASIAQWCLVVAMASVGLGTSLERLRKLGWMPLAVGFVAAILVGGVSYLMIRGLGAFAG